MNKIFFVIGASGAGKTTAVKKLEETNLTDFNFCYFDSIGVPSDEEMIRLYGSGEEWQRVNTNNWTKKIKDLLDSKPTILDGQTRPSFINEACKENDVTDYEVILFDCSDEVRKKRLINRGHPELASDRMMNWAKYLREESLKLNYQILNNTNLNPEESKEKLFEMLYGKKG